MTAPRAIGSAGTGRKPRRTPGKVEKAARAALKAIDTDHAAGDLLIAVAERLAQDVDDASEVRDRVAAVRGLREVLADLDTAVLPPAKPPRGAPEDGEADDGDVFQIGNAPPGLPPVVGDAEAS